MEEHAISTYCISYLRSCFLDFFCNGDQLFSHFCKILFRIAIALGFYKTRPGWTMVLLLVGKFGRFLVWNLVYGLF